MVIEPFVTTAIRPINGLPISVRCFALAFLFLHTLGRRDIDECFGFSPEDTTSYPTWSTNMRF